MTPLRSKRNLSIEGLRGFLAVSVLIFHVYEMGVKVGFYPTTTSQTILSSGIYIVTIFFCVSGFLITQSLLAKDDIASFFKNRIIRIYPVFLLLHLIIFGLGPPLHYEWMSQLRGNPAAYARDFLSNLFFLPGLLALPLAQKNAWSLSYEAVFYIVAALMYVLRKKKERIGLGLLVTGCVGAIWLRPLLAFFVVGLIAYWLQGKVLHRTRGIDLLGIAGFLAGFYLFTISSYLAAIPVLLFFIAVTEQAGMVGAALQTRPMLFLGKISYSLYLVHPFVLDPLRGLLEASATRGHRQAAAIVFPVLGSIAAVAVSALSFHFVEQKFTRAWLGRKDNSHVTGKAVAVIQDTTITH